MPPLPEVIILVLVPFALLFSHRVWLHAQLLLLGAILVESMEKLGIMPPQRALRPVCQGTSA
jgi:hypothetical protein